MRGSVPSVNTILRGWAFSMSISFPNMIVDPSIFHFPGRVFVPSPGRDKMRLWDAYCNFSADYGSISRHKMQVFPGDLFLLCCPGDLVKTAKGRVAENERPNFFFTLCILSDIL